MVHLTWKNKSAIKLYSHIVKLFGEPVDLVEHKDGLAIWMKHRMKKKVFGLRNVFQEHILRDETVSHNCPKKHTDFFYSYIKIEIPPHKLPYVLSLSGSIGYDPLKKYFYARCASLDANIATLKVATDILLDKKVEIKLDGEMYKYKGFEDIQRYGIYGKTISNTKKEGFTKKLYQDLVNNLIKYNKIYKIEELGYWKAAFSYKNGECLPPNKMNKMCNSGRKSGGRNKPNKPTK